MGTKMVTVKALTPGMTLGEAVLSPSGKVLLAKDVVLTPKMISLMNTWAVNYVYICAENEQESVRQATSTAKCAKPEVRSDIAAECLKFFQEYDTVVTTVAQSFDFIRSQKKVPVLRLKDAAFGIYSSILTSSMAFMYLLISDYKLADAISRHSVMVAFISGMIGRQLALSEEQIRKLTLAGLLHDIGKLVYNPEDLSKSQNHVVNGVMLLKDVNSFPAEVLLAVLQHHEYIDGSGFPLGIDESRIHIFAKIIAVADVFHSQAYAGEYANPFPILDVLLKEMFGKLDPGVCYPFINRVRDSLMHNYLLLNDGREVEIVFFHPNNSGFPVVKTKEGKFIDLAARVDIKVSHVLAPEYFPQ